MLTNIILSSGQQIADISVIGALPTDPYILKAITGLGPPDINLMIGDYSYDGGPYLGRRVPKRQIVIRIGINPDYSDPDPVGSVRDKLYETLSPALDSEHVWITLIDNVRPQLSIVGYVEKFEMPVSEPEVEAQLTFICPNPYFGAASSTILSNMVGTANVVYPGTAQTGFSTSLLIPSNTAWVQLARGSKVMRFESAWLSGDEIRINTVRGTRSIKLYRGGSLTDALDTMTPTSQWLTLDRGTNPFVATAAAGTPTISAFTYTARYWGL